MTEELWTKVDNFFETALLPKDDALQFAIENSRRNGLPEIAVSPHLGNFLSLLAKSCGAKRVLEVGTLGGYSTIWLARAVGSEGQVLTLELEDHHADVASMNVKNAGIESRVEILRGPAQASLEKMVESATPPFDFVFIDADKESSLPYFQLALQLTAPEAVLVVDNVVRGGEVLDSSSEDSRVQGVQRLIHFLKDCREVDCSFLQTVGTKGYDGFVLARKSQPS